MGDITQMKSALLALCSVQKCIKLAAPTTDERQMGANGKEKRNNTNYN